VRKIIEQTHRRRNPRNEGEKPKSKEIKDREKREMLKESKWEFEMREKRGDDI